MELYVTILYCFFLQKQLRKYPNQNIEKNLITVYLLVSPVP